MLHLLVWAAGRVQYNCGTLRNFFTKPLTQVAARPSIFNPHLKTKLLKEPDKEWEIQLQEGHDVVRLKLLVLLGQHLRDVYQLGVLDGVPVPRDHAPDDVGDEHVELPVQTIKKLNFVTLSYTNHTDSIQGDSSGRHPGLG